MSELDLGRLRGAARADRDHGHVRLPIQALLRHMMALGSSGSGKTVLSKVVVEEVVRAGVPALVLDPQGDLCSLALAADDPDALAERGLDPAIARSFAERCDVVVFTPASSKGVALGADPLAAIVATRSGDGELDEELWTRAAGTIAALLGYAGDDEDGQGFVAVLDKLLRDLADAGRSPASMKALCDHLDALDDAALRPYARYWELKPLRAAIRKLARLEVGPRRRLFEAGVPLDIDVLLGLGAVAPTPPGKTRVAVIHLNSLHQQEDKEFLVAAIAERLYAWMLARPSAEPQVLFYLDEVAPYIPPVRKPQCKDSLQLLFKQARKYGVCCLMATQNPGDVDYRAMAQFGTWALGRLMTRQDLKKVEPTVKSLAPAACDAIMAELPKLEPGQFVLLSPDHFAEPVGLQARWLYTQHATLDESAIETLADERWRERFATAVERRPAPPAPEPTRAAKPEAQPEAQPTQSPPKARKSADTAGREPRKTAATSKPDLQREAAARPPALEPRSRKSADTATPEPAPSETAPTRKPEPSNAAVRSKPEPGNTALPNELARPRKPSKAERAAAEREQQLTTLRSHGPLTVKRFAELLGCSETKARRALDLLVDAKLVGDFKDGRASAYWALDTGARPDLGMPDAVLVATPNLGQDQAAVLAQGHVKTSLLGLGGPAESLVNVSLVHKLLWRVDFEERIEAGLLGRLVGPRHEQRLGSVYLHPRSLATLTWDASKGLRFVERPAEHASDVRDLDGVVRFTRLAPAGLRFDEREWSERASAEQVRATIGTRWPTARIVDVAPCFLPLWKLMIRRHEPAGMRVVSLDTIAGHDVAWPAVETSR